MPLIEASEELNDIVMSGGIENSVQVEQTAAIISILVNVSAEDAQVSTSLLCFSLH